MGMPGRSRQDRAWTGRSRGPAWDGSAKTARGAAPGVELGIFEDGMWRSLVAHLTGGQGVAGSNPVIPTNFATGVTRRGHWRRNVPLPRNVRRPRLRSLPLADPQRRFPLGGCRIRPAFSAFARTVGRTVNISTRANPSSVLPFVMLLSVIAACGDSSPNAPTAPPSQTPGAAPAAAFAIIIDSLGSEEALAAVSEVTVDASGSTGSGLQYQIDFGDGALATERQARHIYSAPGAYNVTVTVTDQGGRDATVSRQVVVASPVGVWVHSGYFSRIDRVEVRSLAITAQDSSNIRGVLTKDSAGRTPVTGSLTADRRVRLVLDGTGEAIEGVLPSRISVDGAAWPLSLRGGSIDGESLTFKRVPGEPAGAPPDAALRMRFFSFGAPFAVKQISPVLFDGSASRGDDLSYYIEFGDGQMATAATTTHPVDRAGLYTARLTVVDRFGRSDSETTQYIAHSLITLGWFWLGAYREEGCRCVVTAGVNAQDGTSVTGWIAIDVPPFGGPVKFNTYRGTIQSNGEVSFTSNDLGASITGTLSLPAEYLDSSRNRLTLTFHGGRHDGLTVSLYGYSSY
jgi:PKD repeat protein